ncbi:MAG: methyltransferase domain-containing protein [Thermodesulfobacteriota bacterium]
MLQLAGPSFVAQGLLAKEKGFPPSWKDMDELERLSDEWIELLREERSRVAALQGFFPRVDDALDRAVRTDASEYMDDPDLPAKKRVRQVRLLHLMNRMLQSYRLFLWHLVPLAREIAAREGRPARFLELACGSGELTLELCRLAQKRGLPLAITGSDYMRDNVEAACREAEKRNIPARFIVANAFAMDDVERGAYDVVFISQAAHHFTPGQVAKMIAQARSLGARAFVSIDGHRGLSTLFALGVFSGLTLRPRYIHDAVVSGRKLYSESELAALAEIAAPGAGILVRRSLPSHTVLLVRFDLGREQRD